MAYISVNDAVERTGKGQTTIYRFCRKFEHTRHIKREDKKFLIDEDFLSRHLTSAENEAAANIKQEKAKPELIDVYIEELLKEKQYYRQLIDRKDEQLERKDSIIASLQERQKELHYLLNHQTQLLEESRKPEPEAEQKPGVPEKEKNQEKQAAFAGSAGMLYEASTVYAILAAVGFLLFLAIIFVDELRALMES